MRKMSLQLRLLLSFLGIAAAVWTCAAVISWQECREQLDEFFDTYQLRMAKQLAAADWSSLTPDDLRKSNQITNELDNDGDEEDEALGFAVFDAGGKMIFHDNENGAYFPYLTGFSGFSNFKIGSKHKKWRLVQIPAHKGNYMITVGQELEFRNDAALDMVEESLLPWLAGLGILMTATFGLAALAFRPLKKISRELSQRDGGDLSPLDDSLLPPEIMPLTQALNSLFIRQDQLLQRERAFIADSAHELRSPLTALKVQLEVAQMAADDEPVRAKALKKLESGIARACRLVEQLLALSRLESNREQINDALDWQALLYGGMAEVSSKAEAKQIKILIQTDNIPPCRNGFPLLLELMLRNLLDNAVRYSPEGSEIILSCNKRKLCVSNPAPNFNTTDLTRLGERFFRPAGQKETGSGLGLSIIRRIAELHHLQMQITYENGIFCVSIRA